MTAFASSKEKLTPEDLLGMPDLGRFGGEVLPGFSVRVGELFLPVAA